VQPRQERARRPSSSLGWAMPVNQTRLLLLLLLLLLRLALADPFFVV
jgi:hypothetical protein